MKIRTISFLLLFPLLLSAFCLVSCGENVTPYEKLLSFGEKYPLPAGRMYDSTASTDEQTHLSPALLFALFGKENDQSEDILSFALFLGTSLSSPYEMGVVLSPDPEAAKEVCVLFSHRLSLLAASPRVDQTAQETAFVRQYGRWAVYVILPDNAKAERILDSLF